MDVLEVTIEADEENNTLSPREQEIRNMLLVGSTPKEISYNMNISYNTVASHQKSIYRKMGVKSINEFLSKSKNIESSSLTKGKSTALSFISWYLINDSDSTINIQKINEEIIGGGGVDLKIA